MVTDIWYLYLLSLKFWPGGGQLSPLFPPRSHFIGNTPTGEFCSTERFSQAFVSLGDSKRLKLETIQSWEYDWRLTFSYVQWTYVMSCKHFHSSKSCKNFLLYYFTSRELLDLHQDGYIVFVKIWNNGFILYIRWKSFVPCPCTLCQENMAHKNVQLFFAAQTFSSEMKHEISIELCWSLIGLEPTMVWAVYNISWRLPLLLMETHSMYETH